MLFINRCWLYLLVLLIMSGQASAGEKLHIYTENYPPYNMSVSGQAFAHKADDIEGLCTEMVTAIMKRSGVDYSIKLRNWANGFGRAKRKPNNAIFCAAKTEEREPFFHWVGPLASIDWVLFAKPGSEIKLKSLDQAKKYRIGGYKGDVMSEYLIGKGFNVSTMANDRLNPRKLMIDQIDLWVTDGLSGPYIASEAEDVTGLVPVLKFNSTALYLAVNKETDPDTVAALNKAFKQVNESGEAQSISDAYLQ